MSYFKIYILLWVLSGLPYPNIQRKYLLFGFSIKMINLFTFGYLLNILKRLAI